MATAVVYTATTIAANAGVALGSSDESMASFNGLQGVFILPLGNGTAASTAAPIHEVLTTATTPGAGKTHQTNATTANNGDAVPAHSIVIIQYNAVGETLNPASA